MPIFDTSVLVALFDEKDARHKEALKATARDGPFILPGVILGEFLAVLTRRATLTGVAAGPELRATLQSLEAQPAIRIREAYDHTAAAALFRTHPALSFPDAVAVSLAIELDEDLVTFDSDQAAAALTGAK